MPEKLVLICDVEIAILKITAGAYFIDAAQEANSACAVQRHKPYSSQV